MARPRNILLIHTDQHRFDCLGAHGHPLVQTPNLDRLIAEGTTFSRAFTPSPICSPARASLLTGTWPSVHGCRGIPKTECYAPVNPELPLLTGLLRDADYRQGWVGKFHGEVAGKPDRHGVDDFLEHGDRYNQWRAEQGLPPKPWSGGTWGYFGNVDPHITPDQSSLAWEADQVLGLMEQYAAGDQPFMLRWDPIEPHLPCIPPEPFASMYNPDDIEPWPGFDDPLEKKPWAQRNQRRMWHVEGWTWKQWAPTVALYLAEVSLLDAQVGRLLAKLDDLGLAGDTLVVYSTDHGDLCGDHGMMDKHFIMYDSVTQVPLILRGPGVPAGETCGDFVCNEIDIAATALEIAGVEPPDSFVGRSLLTAARGEDPEPRRDMISQYFGAQFGLYSQRMLRDERWKYVWNATDRDELYDTQKDPGELFNLIEDPDYTSQLRRLRRRLGDWMTEIDDPMLNMWTRVHIYDEVPPQGGVDLHTDN